MFPFNFFSKRENAELATLLIVSPLSEKEKRAWIMLMPEMTVEEKRELHENLREEIVDYKKLQEESFEALNQKIEKLFQPS